MHRTPVLACLLLALSAASCTAADAEKPAKLPDLKTLIWTYTDFAELRANARLWHENKGIDGFIFCFVNKPGGGPPRLDSGPDRVKEIYSELPETVAALKAAGIDSNFVHANLDDTTWSWLDGPRVAKLAPTFGALAATAKASGCRGVAIDTEAYAPTLWDPDKYPAERRAEIENRIHDTGAAVIDAILAEFPEAEILILPEGAYIDLMNAPGGYHIYGWWMEFFNGIASRKPSQGLTVLAECAYDVKDPLDIALLHGRLSAAMTLGSEDPVYWLNKCGVAHGAALILKDGTKVSRTPKEFAQQWETMGRFSTRYRWIFAGESGFTCYPAGVQGFRIQSFATPLSQDADRYFAVLRKP